MNPKGSALLLRILACAILALVPVAPAAAATIAKGNNTTSLNQTGSWTGGVVPGTGDIALWNSTVTSANTVLLGGNLSWLGLALVNPGGNVTISAGNTLTLGASGINMTAATQNLILNNAVVLNGTQTWNINTQTATVTGVISGNSTSGLTKSGTGTLTLSISSTINLGAGASIVSFANSSAGAWTSGAVLSILNWSGSASGNGTDQIYFGTTSSNLTSSQLSQIQFVNPAGLSAGTYGAQLLSTGELVPIIPLPAVPEVSTTAAGVTLLTLLGLTELRRRRPKFFKNNLIAGK